MRLRVVTWNIRHGVGQDGRLDLGRIASRLDRLAADVIGLQEVDRAFGARSEWRDEAVELAQALRLHLQWGPALRLPPQGAGDPVGEYGVALLTRAPARLVELRPIRVAGSEDRVVLHARVEAPPTGLSVLVTHLDPASRSVREAQAIQVAGVEPSGPALLLGDLNALPQARELRPLRGWSDAWALAPRRSGGVWPLQDAVAGWLAPWLAASGLAGRTHPAATPRRRIDAVLLRGPVRAVRAAVPRVSGSDHLPVVVDVEVRDDV